MHAHTAPALLEVEAQRALDLAGRMVATQKDEPAAEAPGEQDTVGGE